MQQQINDWLNGLANKANQETIRRKVRFILDRGRRFTKIVKEECWEDSGNWDSKSVHAFIENATGDIYKAASWKAPAKNGARFNVVNDFDRLMEVCDIYGSYLYKR